MSFECVNLTVEQWVNVLFTDESMFGLQNDSRRIRSGENVEHDFGLGQRYLNDPVKDLIQNQSK